MLNIYPAFFHKEDDGFWVEFPDLEGCQTSADTLNQSMELASEALGLYIATLLDNNLEVPNKSDIQTLTPPNDCFVSYVYTDSSKYRNKNKAIKKTLTIPQWLNEEAEKRHVNFSNVLQTALKEHLNF